jgi:hypothetical protein
VNRDAYQSSNCRLAIHFVQIESKLTLITCTREGNNSHGSFAVTIFLLVSFLPFAAVEPRKDKTDSSNGNNNALSPQEQHQLQMQQHHQQQQQHHLQHQANMHMMQQGGMGGEPMIKPERPNSLGPKLSKRINFYHDTCKSHLASLLRTALISRCQLSFCRSR